MADHVDDVKGPVVRTDKRLPPGPKVGSDHRAPKQPRR